MSENQDISNQYPYQRTASIDRKTKETEVHIELNLDGKGKFSGKTGLGFLDHMLSHIAVHGLFDLNIQAVGDLEVDSHHLVEDVAITLGSAFSAALGDRKGIERMGSASAPMDEALAHVYIDFSGRPYCVVNVNWATSMVGSIPTSLFQHFLESFSVTARCNLHADVPYGRDDHHKAEAIFKALGRALEQAVQINSRRGGQIPSTKGVL